MGKPAERPKKRREEAEIIRSFWSKEEMSPGDPYFLLNLEWYRVSLLSWG